MIHLHASNLFNIQVWLDNDETPYLKVHVWSPAPVTVGIPSSQTVNVTTIEVVRETVRLSHDWTMDFAHTSESYEPIVFGKPITLAEHRGRRG